MNTCLPLKIAAVLLLLHLPPAGCGPASRETVSVREVKNTKTIEMTAGSFYFEPAVIQATIGDVLSIAIENVSDGNHNFTLESPAGEIMLSVDLPADRTREVEFRLAESASIDSIVTSPFIRPWGCEAGSRFNRAVRQQGLPAPGLSDSSKSGPERPSAESLGRSHYYLLI